ncbi:Uncharacterized protein TCM_009711 [Theobroma cacao]|uniref:RNase H type-1 domain-containing protein n=1 Tax=Theobroma cacao TaxID=3641 RepID=A0A061E6A1_THECC|nr:Uncharacterized protein TCM_009711 [Theobroma cacao]
MACSKWAIRSISKNFSSTGDWIKAMIKDVGKDELEETVCAISSWMEGGDEGRCRRCPKGLKINCDAAIFFINGGKLAGAGFIVRDSNGEFILAGATKLAYNSSVAMVELRSLLWSLMVCFRDNVLVKKVKIDCKQIVSWVKEKHYNGDMGHVVEARNLLIRQLTRY